MKSTFYADRQTEIDRVKGSLSTDILTEERLKTLPVCLQRHFRLCGYVDKPLAMNADILWKESYLKLKPGSRWNKLKTVQFNSVHPIMRSAYMKLKAIPFAGKDLYQNGQGSMIGKIFGLFTVMKTMGKEVSQSALVTSFCEMMLLSGYAFQEYIVWKPLDEKTLEATLTDGGMSVSGVFHFDDKGLFSYFETDDRFFDNGQNNYSKEKFKAVMDSYKKAGEMYYPENVRVQWCLEDGDYDYFKGTIEEIRYNTE